MKTLLTTGTLLFALSIQQFPVAPPPPAAGPQRGAVSAPLSAAECKCSIDVTVKRQSNGAPISDAAVTLTFNSPVPAAPAGAAATAPPARVVLTGMTDEAGRANFPSLAEGTYSITVQHEGFFGPSFNGNSPTSVFTIANVGPAAGNLSTLMEAQTSAALSRGGTSPGNIARQPVQHVAVSLVEGGIISGRIQDANHRPAAGISVTSFQISYQDGRRVLRPLPSRAQTDDLGQYRLFWFAPGEFYIATEPPPVAGVRGGGPNFVSPTYYPGTLDLARARTVNVHEGEEISGIDFEPQTGGGVTISGTVTNLIPARTNPNGEVIRTVSQFYLVPRNSNVQEPARAIPNIAPSGARGARGGDATEIPFEIRGVPPGKYDFYPIFNDGATPRSNFFTGHIEIEVGSENISGIHSVVQPGVDLKIHVSVTGTPPTGPGNRPAQPLSMQNVLVEIRPVDNLPVVLTAGQLSRPVPDADGNISLTNLPEVRLFVSSVYSGSADSYVSEIRQGSKSLTDDTILNIGKEAPDPLEVVISRDGSTISGTLEDDHHQPVIGTRVLLIPDLPRRRNLLLYKTATSVAKGAFTFQGIAPGIYKVFAFDNIPQGAEQNDEFMSRYEGSGTRVSVSAGAPVSNVQVTLTQGNR